MQVFRRFLFPVILIASLIMMSVGIEKISLQNDSFVQNRNKSMYGIMREPKNSIDVVVLGDSLSYTSVSPMEWWKKYGITSYVCGQSGQTIQETFYMLKKVFKTQSPQLIMLETHTLFKDQLGIKGVKERLGEWGNYYIPFFRGHDIWKAILTGKRYKENSYKGFSIRSNIKASDKINYMVKTESWQPIPDNSVYYMKKIIKMCKEKNAELFLFSTPSPKNYNYSKHNGLKKFAKKYKIKYLDLNMKVKKAGINWKTDSLDNGDHLNFSGAQKITAFLGKYLENEYQLPDHRKETKCQSWNTDYQKYKKEASQIIMN